MRIRVVATFALIILAVLVVYVFLTVGLVEELEVEGFRDDGGALVASLYDGGRYIAGGIRVEPIGSKGSSRTLLRVEIWHIRGTRLDSLLVAFEGGLQFEVFPAFDRSPPIEFHRSVEGGAVVFSAPDLELRGGGVMLEFYVTPRLAEPLELNVRFEISIRDEGVVGFRRMGAEAVAALTMQRE